MTGLNNRPSPSRTLLVVVLILGSALNFSAGCSISGERYTVWYLGLYWTGGPEKTDKK